MIGALKATVNKAHGLSRACGRRAAGLGLPPDPSGSRRYPDSCLGTAGDTLFGMPGCSGKRRWPISLTQALGCHGRHPQEHNLACPPCRVRLSRHHQAPRAIFRGKRLPIHAVGEQNALVAEARGQFSKAEEHAIAVPGLRQYSPKRQSMAHLTQHDCATIAPPTQPATPASGLAIEPRRNAMSDEPRRKTRYPRRTVALQS